jgi:hypothetical protein
LSANYASAALDIALDQGDLRVARRALNLLRTADADLRHKYGTSHPDFLAVLNNLAVAQLEVARAARDPSTLRAAVGDLRKAYSLTAQIGHPDVLTMLADLGYAELELALLSPIGPVLGEAIRVNRHALEKIVTALGAHHPLTRRVINQLRECHRLQQLSERAQRVASESASRSAAR